MFIYPLQLYLINFVWSWAEQAI